VDRCFPWVIGSAPRARVTLPQRWTWPSETLAQPPQAAGARCAPARGDTAPPAGGGCAAAVRRGAAAVRRGAAAVRRGAALSAGGPRCPQGGPPLCPGRPPRPTGTGVVDSAPVRFFCPGASLWARPCRVAPFHDRGGAADWPTPVQVVGRKSSENWSGWSSI